MSRGPLHPTTYLLRNAAKTIPLIAVILLAVMLVMGIVSMINSIPYSIRTIYSYSKNVLGVTPRGDPEMTPKIEKDIREQSPYPIERIIRCRASGAQVKSIVGKWPFVVLGMKREDLEYFLKKLGAERVEGRLPEAGQPEVVISEPVARNLGLKLGDNLLSPDTQEMYSPLPVKVVGIAQTTEWLMFNDITYQQENHFPPIENVLVFGKDLETQDKIDRWAYEEFRGERAQVLAYFQLEENTQEMFSILYRILDVVIGTLVLVITFMMGMQMNIYQSQRLVEFGLLQAIGYTKRQLIQRVFLETAIVIVSGWLLGVGSALLLLNVVKRILMDPRAFALNTLDQVSILYTVPIPIAITIVAVLTVTRRFSKFDPVGVVERRLV
jgi:ABC-type lipoprotein release transport system permease subunit